MNKKILLLIGSFLLTSFVIRAQQQHKYGFRAGLNYSYIDFDDSTTGLIGDAENDPRIGFAAGFFAIYSLSEKFSVQPEIQFSAQGQKTKVINEESLRNSSTDTRPVSFDRLNYSLLQIPVLLNYHISRKIKISAGPQLGIRVFEWERKDDYEPFVFSLLGGIGYDITYNLGVDLRASFGITDIIDTDKSTEDIEKGLLNGSGVNHYLQLTFSYSL